MGVMGTPTWWESELVQSFQKIRLEMHTAFYPPFNSWVGISPCETVHKIVTVAQFVTAIKLEAK